MATVQNTSDLELQATSPRMVTTNLPSNATVDFATQVTGSQKPSNNADVTSTALNGGVTMTGGSITLDAGGHIKGGQTAFDTGNGFWVGYASTEYKLSFKNAGGQSFKLSTAGVEIVGDVKGASTIDITGRAEIDGSGSFGPLTASLGVNRSRGASIGVLAETTAGSCFYAQTSSSGSGDGFNCVQASVGFRASGCTTGARLSGTTALWLNGGNFKFDNAYFDTGSVTPTFNNKPGAGTTVKWVEIYDGSGAKWWVPAVKDT